MKADDKALLKEIINNLRALDYINPDAIPNIDLYIDQVLTFLDGQLMPSKRSPDDKAITRTMINNYVKSKLLPAPEKKRYTREHVLTLIFVYYLKNFLSIPDIESILSPLTERYFAKDSERSLADVYEQIVIQEKSHAEKTAKDLIRIFEASRKSFPDATEEEADFLHNFSLICSLSFEVYMKKKVLESIIDQTIEPLSRSGEASNETDDAEAPEEAKPAKTTKAASKATKAAAGAKPVKTTKAASKTTKAAATAKSTKSAKSKSTKAATK